MDASPAMYVVNCVIDTAFSPQTVSFMRKRWLIGSAWIGFTPYNTKEEADLLIQSVCELASKQ